MPKQTFYAIVRLTTEAETAEEALRLLHRQTTVPLSANDVRVVLPDGQDTPYPPPPDGLRVATVRISVSFGVGPRDIVIALPVGAEPPAPRSTRGAKCEWFGNQYDINDFPAGTMIADWRGWRPLQGSDLPIKGVHVHTPGPSQ